MSAELSLTSKVQVNQTTSGIPAHSLGGTSLLVDQTNKQMVSATYALTTSNTELTVFSTLTEKGVAWFYNPGSVTVIISTTGPVEAFKVYAGMGLWVPLVHGSTYYAKTASSTSTLYVTGYGA